VMHAVSQILDQLKLILSHRATNGDLLVGVDPKPANFTRDQGKVWYVDLMPPRFRRDDGQVVLEYPQPRTDIGRSYGYFRHFTVPGVLFLLQTQIARLNPGLLRDVMREIDIFCKAFAPEALACLRNLNERVREIVEGKQVCQIHGFGPADGYNMRAIGCAVAAKIGITPDWLSDLFRLSHFEDGIPDERLDQVKSLLEREILRL